MYSNFVYLINCFSYQFPVVDLRFSNRYLSRLKSYMHSKTYLEDSITEGYIAEECLVFCSCYFKFVETAFNRPVRNVEKSMGAMVSITLDSNSWIQAHRYVLFNCVDLGFSNRYLSRLKSYVHNKTYLEDSITEGYIAEECLVFYSRYFKSIETAFNRLVRNVEESMGAVVSITLNSNSWIQAHRYELFNCEEITPFRE